MKKMIFFFFMVCVCAVQAQVKTIRNPMGTILAFECANGDIKNAGIQPVMMVNDTLGEADTLVNEEVDIVNPNATVLVSMQDGITIIEGTGAVVANYDPVSKELRDSNNHLIFYLDSSGYVKDEMDVPIGHIDELGNVYGSDSNKIAEAPGIAPFKLAYLFFYSNK